jgi:hypothetical protein
MPRPRPISAETQIAILSYVRAGGFPLVAAEAAGVARRDFLEWMRRGRQPRGGKQYREFSLAVAQAHAQARLKAEVAVFQNRPLDWLKCGPGRDAPGAPGWAAAVKAAPPEQDESARLTLDHPFVAEVVERLMTELEPFPEARLHLSGVDFGNQTRRKRSARECPSPVVYNGDNN